MGNGSPFIAYASSTSAPRASSSGRLRSKRTARRHFQAMAPYVGAAQVIQERRTHVRILGRTPLVRMLVADDEQRHLLLPRVRSGRAYAAIIVRAPSFCNM